MSLKDNAKLVKMYALVNVSQYQIVATGTTVAECEKAYKKLMQQNNIQTDTENTAETTVTSPVTDIRSAVINGNTFYYIKLEGTPYVSLSAGEYEEAVTLNIGDTVEVTYTPDESKSIVKADKFKIK